MKTYYTVDDRTFSVGDIVKHFKRETIANPGALYLYQINNFAKNTETGEILVIYTALYNSEALKVHKDTFARPAEMFFSLVDTAKYPDIKQVWRFEHFDFRSDCEEVCKSNE